jgi:hypothetical protein
MAPRLIDLPCQPGRFAFRTMKIVGKVNDYDMIENWKKKCFPL